MASATVEQTQERFGATARKDNWWAGPLATFLGLLAFLIYANVIVFFVPGYFEIRQDKTNFFKPDNPAVAPYIAPFHSPLLFDGQSHHAWIHADKPSWWPGWFPFSSAMLILIFPAGFRFTCYYYRKAYYRAFWLDPPACTVGEPRKSYWGENHWPLLLQNCHRYFMYFAVLFLLLLTWDALLAFWWPTDRGGNVLPNGQFGMGLGTLIMWVNIVLLAGFTFGCNSVRHLVGGRVNHFACFSCPAAGGAPQIEKLSSSYRLWRFSTYFNDNHMLWAWLSLFSVGFTDFYIRMCAAGYWNDVRFF
ncbi:MAG TPA: hypothetical protein VGY58_19210 [Gemmataceae bacterium]|jgi:hypothetical protein|nr:hypothetical protein [Gemmataceae bacterium]